MKNAHDDMDALWPQVRSRGSAALRPDLAGRVLARTTALRGELSMRSTLTLGLATALACLTLTLAMSAWRAHRASDQAMDAWASFNADNSVDQDT